MLDFIDLEKVAQELMWNQKRPQRVKGILRSKNTAKSFTQPYLK